VVADQQAAISVVPGNDGTKTWTYRAVAPTETYLLYARSMSEVRSNDGGFPVVGYVKDDPVSRERMQRAVDLGSQLIPVFGELFIPIPVNQAHLLSNPTTFNFAGMGLLGNVLMGEYIFGDDRFEYLIEQGTAHELAHTWWGNLASAWAPDSAVFSEGLAEYSAWLALGRVKSSAAVRTSGVRMSAVWYMYARPPSVDIAIFDPNAAGSEAYRWVTYHKGSVAFRTLEESVGIDAFHRALRAFIKRGPRVLSPAGFIEDMTTHTGLDAAEIDQWFRRTGYPKLKVTPKLEGTNLRLEVASPDSYSFWLPVVVHLADGTRLRERIRLNSGMAAKTFELPAEVLSVELDPEWTAVRELTPATREDVTFDGQVDAADLMAVALNQGGYLPTTRREDGRYDPLFDLNGDRRIDGADLEQVLLSPAD
jgi:aminopeptidase N